MTTAVVDPGLLERGGLALDVDGPRATISLARPDVLNAQTPVTWDVFRSIGAGRGPRERYTPPPGGKRGRARDGTVVGAPDRRRLSAAPGRDGTALAQQLEQH
jgi:hypothetical protein